MIQTTDHKTTDSDEVSLKELILKIQHWWRYLLSKWLVILIAGTLGSVVGLSYAWLKEPIYRAQMSFTLQDDKSSGGLSSAMGLASQFGIDLGGAAAGGEFSGENLLELMKSRHIVEKALLSTVIINGKETTLAEYYINFNNLRKKWKNTPNEYIHFLPNADVSKFTLIDNSILNMLYKSLISKELSVDKLDKKLSIISLKVNSKNEYFSKYFVEAMAKVISDFYVETKTKKATKNVAILQHQTDSIRQNLYLAISGVASSLDATPNPNPSLLTLRVPSQRRTIDVTANTAILSELVKQLVIAKTSLLQETPLIQIIDRPIFPLEKIYFSKSKGLILGGIIGLFISVISLLLNKTYNDIMKS